MEQQYGAVDIPGAQQLLQEAGVTTPVDVRFHFAANNPRRANEYDLMKASAAQAGFNLIDGRSPSWGQQLPNIEIYDASLFGWQSTGTGITESMANFVTGGSNNYGQFSNQTVDQSYDGLAGSVLEPDQVTTDLTTVEKTLVDQAFGVTIYQFPGVTSFNSTKVQNVGVIPLGPGPFFNYWEWTPAS